MRLRTLFPEVPVLHTERLELRSITPSDAPAIMKLRGNPEIMKYVPRPLTQSLDEAIQLIREFEAIRERGEGITWGICVKQEQVLVGTIAFLRTKPENFRTEIGYLLDPVYQGQGIMKEAIQRVVSFGFDVMGLHSIEAVVVAENIPSIKVLHKCGFIKEGFLRDYQYFNGGFHNTLIYSLLADGDSD